MKPSFRPLLLLPLTLCLVSWSPPDPLVGIGTNNDTDGHTGTNPDMTITPFRGFLSGKSNIVGSVNSSDYFGSVVGSHNKANLYSSILVGDQNQIALTADSANLPSFVRFSGIIGNYNVMANGCTSVLVAGYSNTVAANTSLVSGAVNTVGGATEGPQFQLYRCHQSIGSIRHESIRIRYLHFRRHHGDDTHHLRCHESRQHIRSEPYGRRNHQPSGRGCR